MKLNESRPTIESSGGMVEQMFAIEDTGMIFDILRNKMYSDPIRAICREISSNARDAHREVGKESVPCEITLPNTFEHFYKIKDFGPGISPERMSNVFIKYTGSTKRNDNTQTGGFGLGAKTPFSYNDEFVINTVHNGVKYSYNCFIDETKVGKLVCMNESPTTEPNSTEIEIPVKSKDFRKFYDDTEFVTRHWDVKPTIKGATITYQKISPSLKGNSYAICKSTSNNVIREVKLVVDGIEYPLDPSQLTGVTSTKVLDAINGIFYLYFGIGELSLSATRESVHLDASTKTKIGDKLQEIIKDLTDDVSKQIDAQPTFWDANFWSNTQLNKIFTNTNFVGVLDWKGLPLFKGAVKLDGATVHAFTKGKRTRTSYNANKIHKNVQQDINFVENSAIYVCDLDLNDIHVKHVNAAYAANPNLKYVFVVNANAPNNIDTIATKYRLNELGAKKLSTITKATKSHTISGVRLLVFKFMPGEQTFKQVSYANMEEDSNEKIICSLVREYNGTKNVVLKSKKRLSNDIVRSLVTSHPKVSIYGIDSDIPSEKVEEHFSDFEPIDKFIDEKVLNNKKFDFAEIKYATKNQCNLDRHIEKLESFKPRIVEKNSPYFKYVELNLKLKKLASENGILFIYEQVNNLINENEVANYLILNPHMNFKKGQEEMQAQYPLLMYMDYYNQKSAEPIIHYINLIDKELKSLGKI